MYWLRGVCLLIVWVLSALTTPPWCREKVMVYYYYYYYYYYFLKWAKILPIFNSKDKLNNYRPISILPVISKVYEKVFYSDNFSTNNILSSSQFGFRSGACTEHALLKFTDDIFKYFDDNKVGIATFMDISKAFDCVDHKILLTKIKRYCVHSTPLRWICSYLSSRARFVSWNQI